MGADEAKVGFIRDIARRMTTAATTRVAGLLIGGEAVVKPGVKYTVYRCGTLTFADGSSSHDGAYDESRSQ